MVLTKYEASHNKLILFDIKVWVPPRPLQLDLRLDERFELGQFCIHHLAALGQVSIPSSLAGRSG
jgi:hypothetical protein